MTFSIPVNFALDPDPAKRPSLPSRARAALLLLLLLLLLLIRRGRLPRGAHLGTRRTRSRRGLHEDVAADRGGEGQLPRGFRLRRRRRAGGRGVQPRARQRRAQGPLERRRRRGGG